MARIRIIYTNQRYLLKICLALTVSSLLIVKFMFYTPNYIPYKWTPVVYDLDLPNCRIPEVPLEPQGYVRSMVEFTSCENEDSFSTLRNGILHVDVPSSTKCCVSEIIRPYEMEGDMFQRGPCIPFNTTSVDVTGREYIAVTCQDEGKLPRHNFHVSVIPSASNQIAKKIEYWKNKRKEDIPMNVFLFVIDSTTRKDAFRYMPKTMNYLLNELNFVDFKGFHFLEEATMPNAIPLLSGIEFVRLNDIKPDWGTSWDKFPFIWKNFDAAKYVTAYTEDMPIVGTFNYGGQSGFTKIPTDFYLRPFLLANEINQWNMYMKKRLCVGNTTMEKFILNYHLEILKRLNGLAPVFLINWPCWPQHDFAGSGLNKLENPMLEFYKNLSREPGILENTLIILMGDHGFYRGKFAKSMQGFHSS